MEYRDLNTGTDASGSWCRRAWCIRVYWEHSHILDHEFRTRQRDHLHQRACGHRRAKYLVRTIAGQVALERSWRENGTDADSRDEAQPELSNGSPAAIGRDTVSTSRLNKKSF
jgi:hypothetical protein